MGPGRRRVAFGGTAGPNTPRRTTSVTPASAIKDKEIGSTTYKLKLLSQEWCDAALDVVIANDTVYEGFKDPDTFTKKLEFGVIGRDDVACHLEFKEGKVVSYTPPMCDESELWLIINGNFETWQAAATGKEEGGRLLMKEKIKFAKGPMSAAIANAGALDNFPLTWVRSPPTGTSDPTKPERPAP